MSVTLTFEPKINKDYLQVVSNNPTKFELNLVIVQKKQTINYYFSIGTRELWDLTRDNCSTICIIIMVQCIS